MNAAVLLALVCGQIAAVVVCVCVGVSGFVWSFFFFSDQKLIKPVSNHTEGKTEDSR